MSKVVTQGKTVEEAIEKALAELSIEREEAFIRIISNETKGFFGLFGRKPAEVEVARRDERAFYQEMLNQILGKMGFDVDVNTVSENGVVHLNIESTDELGGLLIGRSGRTLDALEHLLRRIAVNQGFNTKKIKLDVENYRKRSTAKAKPRPRREAVPV